MATRLRIDLFLVIAVATLCACHANSEHESTRGSGQSANPAAAGAALIHPDTWPAQAPVIGRDPAMEQRIADLVGRMTLEEKVGQVIEADINSVTPDEVRQYNLGSVLNGGNSAPGADNRAAPDKWLALADEFWDASTDTSDGGVGIPTIWGTDAVHGHSNVVGATIFPHNIGLGMANDPELLHDIGRVTALEMLSTGLDWTFAPTIAVVRNDRWGRTYESYSEDPRIVVAYAPRIIEGIQGKLGTDEFLAEGSMVATAKHYTGDGGTFDGHDQGDTRITEQQLRDIQAAGYPAAIRAGVQTVMASYNSFHGRKMHGYREMLTDVLVGRMGFDGFVVGDWNGHGQVEGCTTTSCAAAMNAGLDLFMAPDSWKGLYESTLQQVQSGVIPLARLDEAVSRILRVKMRAHVFEAGRPSSRKHAGDFSLLASPAHRAVARRAVRESLVLLKNNNKVLPLRPGSRVLVTGDGADNIGKQSGGWTLSWQGTGNRNEHFPNGTSIYEGLRQAITDKSGSVVLSKDGRYVEKPDVAVVVFGEDPYAEGVGDRDNVDYAPDDGLRLLRTLKSAGIPTVSVFLSGRPLWVNPELNASDAFVATWLPGTEGGGIADVLVGNADGSARFDFSGRLSFSWPRRPDQASVNLGDSHYDPLFAYGYGLDYANAVFVGVFPEDAATSARASSDSAAVIERGDPADGWTMLLVDEKGEVPVRESRGTSKGGKLTAQPADDKLQEDSIVLTWRGPARLVVTGEPVDLPAVMDGAPALQLTYKVIDTKARSILLSAGPFAAGDKPIDIAAALSGQAGSGWQTATLAYSCFSGSATAESIGMPLAIAADGPLALQIGSASIVPAEDGVGCTF